MIFFIIAWAAFGLGLLALGLFAGGVLWRLAGEVRAEEATARRIFYVSSLAGYLLAVFGLVLLLAALGSAVTEVTP